MTIEIGFTEELTNSQYAPLAALCAHYQQNHVLEPLSGVEIPMSETGFRLGGQADPGSLEYFDRLRNSF